MKLTRAIFAAASAAVPFAEGKVRGRRTDEENPSCDGLCTALDKSCAGSCDGAGKHPLGKGDPKDPNRSCDQLCSLIEENGCPRPAPIEGLWTGFAPGFAFIDPKAPPIPDQFATPTALPGTPDAASDLGWVEGDDGRWTNANSAFGFQYCGKRLYGFDVTGPAVKDEGVTVPAVGTTDNGDDTISYRFQFQGDHWLMGDDVIIPLTSDEAESDGWLQGSCLESSKCFSEWTAYGRNIL